MVLAYGMADSCLYNKQNNTWTLGIYLLVFTFDMLSLVRCAHSYDIDVSTRR